MTKRLLLVALLAFGAYQLLTRSPVDPGPGVLAPEQPRQTEIESAQPFRHNGYRITALADFSLQARVLGAERYRFDREADLAPVDLALGWGPMSDGELLEKLDISQKNRFFFWRTDRMPASRRVIEHNAANMHMVPASEGIGVKLKRLRPGQVIRLEGKLIRADAEDGWRWVSSLRRDDKGRGACELVWVEHVRVLTPAT